MNPRVEQNYGGFMNIPAVGQMQTSNQGYGISTGYNVAAHWMRQELDITELPEYLPPRLRSE